MHSFRNPFNKKNDLQLILIEINVYLNSNAVSVESCISVWHLYLQPLQLFEVLKRSSFNHTDLIVLQMPVEGKRKKQKQNSSVIQVNPKLEQKKLTEI